MLDMKAHWLGLYKIEGEGKDRDLLHWKRNTKKPAVYIDSKPDP
jgi:hypothetical protein